MQVHKVWSPGWSFPVLKSNSFKIKRKKMKSFRNKYWRDFGMNFIIFVKFFFNIEAITLADSFILSYICNGCKTNKLSYFMIYCSNFSLS